MRISDWSSDVCSSDLVSTTAVCSSVAAATDWFMPSISPMRCVTLTSRRPAWLATSTLSSLESWLAFIVVTASREDRKSVVSGKSVSVRVDLGGRLYIKKKQTETPIHSQTQIII